VWTLYKREVWRFLKVINQTLIAPVVTTLLFLAILMLALGGAEREINGLEFSRFVAPGLIMMAIVQNAFANTSSSIVISKFQGVFIDILMPPFAAWEITFSFTMGGITRGVLVGLVVGAATYIFVPFSMHDPVLMIFYVIAASAMLALLGILTGILANSFDQMSMITNYIITPLSFLSGTFYSVKFLPEFWYQTSFYNPFFYMIDGFRYAMTGYSDGATESGIVVLLLTNLVLWLVVQTLFAKGYRLKT
jgi:ABC-2 type transport system permease protein